MVTRVTGRSAACRGSTEERGRLPAIRRAASCVRQVAGDISRCVFPEPKRRAATDIGPMVESGAVTAEAAIGRGAVVGRDIGFVAGVVVRIVVGAAFEFVADAAAAAREFAASAVRVGRAVAGAVVRFVAGVVAVIRSIDFSRDPYAPAGHGVARDQGGVTYAITMTEDAEDPAGGDGEEVRRAA
jgi:tetrahydromethanopterin S-methyltransferase subunit G